MRLQVLTIILCLLFMHGQANAIIQQRHQWWKSRIQKLQQEDESIAARNDIDKRIKKLVHEELLQSRDALRVLKRKINGDASLDEAKKEYTGKEIKEHIRKLVPPLATAWYMNHILKRLNDNSRIDDAGKMIEDSIDNMIQSTMGRDDHSLRKHMINDHFTTFDLRIIAMEIITAPVMEQSRQYIDKAGDEIYTKFINSFAQPVTTTDSMLTHKILTVAQKYFNATGCGSTFRPATGHLERSWRWKGKYSMMAIQLEHYKRIVSLAKKAGVSITPYQASLYYINPQSFEKKIFPSLTKKYRDSRAFKRYSDILNNPEDESSIHVMAIPERFDTGPVLQHLDNLRKKTLPSLQGTENDRHYSKLRDSFIREIKKKFAGLDHHLYREEKKVKDKSSLPGEQHPPVIRNMNAFNDARKLRNAKHNAAMAYADACLEYLRIYGDSRARHGGLVTENYRYRVNRIQDYLNFFHLSGTRIARCPYMTDPDLHNMMKDIAHRSRHMFKAYIAALGLSYDERSALNKENLREIAAMKKKSRTAIQQNATGFITSCKKYFSSYARQVQEREENNDEVKEIIAQYELDTLQEQLSAQMDLFSRLTYADSILEEYRSVFTSLEETARENPHDPRLRKALKNGSLFPLIKNASIQKIKTEYISRQYLHARMNKTLASLVALDNWYNRAGLHPDHRPGERILKNKISALTGHTTISIGKWTMHRKNAQKIDYNAIRHLDALTGKTISRIPPKAIDMRTHTVAVAGKNLTLALPRGWSVTGAESYYKNRGITSRVKNETQTTVMNIARVQGKKNSLRSSSRRWLQSMRYEPVKSGWRSQNGEKLFWVLARDHRDNVVEIYGMHNGNSVYIVSGSVSRKDYPRFHKTFTRIMGSFSVEPAE